MSFMPDHLPEYFEKPGILEGLAEAHPAAIVRQLANYALLLKNSELKQSLSMEGLIGKADTANTQEWLDDIGGILGKNFEHFCNTNPTGVVREIGRLLISKERELKQQNQESFIKWFSNLDDDKRSQLFDKVCKYCGSTNMPCNCNNDE